MQVYSVTVIPHLWSHTPSTQSFLCDHRAATVRIQAAARGYLGRQRALLAREARDKRLRMAYFDAQATTIQRHWRGYWSRKAVFDFRARKLYLARIADMNAKVCLVKCAWCVRSESAAAAVPGLEMGRCSGLNDCWHDTRLVWINASGLGQQAHLFRCS
jgi:hypothetical protein